MKKTHTLAALLVAALATSAQTFTASTPSGHTLTFSVTSGTTVKVVRGATNYTGAMAIPASVSNGGNTYQVTALGSMSLSRCGSITSITIPEGVTALEMGALNYNSTLDTINLPTTLNSIGAAVFAGCGYYTNNDNLSADGLLYCSNYVIGSNLGMVQGEIVVADGTLGIADQVFLRNSQLTKITLPASLRFVGSQSFSICSALDTVVLSSATPPSLAADAFSNPAAVVAAVPCGSAAAYRAHAAWGQMNVVEYGCSGSGDDPGDEPGDDPGDDPGESICGLEPLPALVVPVQGGLSIHSQIPMQYVVSDLTGRTIATIVAAGQTVVPLPAAGVYVVSAVGCKPVKVIYMY